MSEQDDKIAELTEKIRQNPNDAEAYYRRGEAYMDNGDYDDAIADYTEAIRRTNHTERRVTYYYSHEHSTNCMWLYLERRIKAYLKKGDTDSAIAEYTECIRMGYYGADLYFDRGRAYCDKGEYEKAIADYNQSIRLEPYHNEEAYSERAYAIECYEEALRSSQNDTEAGEK